MTPRDVAAKADICRRHVDRSHNVADTVRQLLFNRKSKETS